MNDLPQFLLNSKCYLYADDTAVTVSGNSVQEIEQKLNEDIVILHRWFSANKLCVNVKKTKSMLFHSPHKFNRENNLILTFGTDMVEQVSVFKYLGMYLDPTLMFNNHIDHIVKKVRQRVRILWRMRGFISCELAKSLYISLIDPVYNYCSEVYDGCFLNANSELQVSQNQALRAVLKRDNRADTQLLHTDSGIKWLDQSRRESCCKLVYKLTNGIGPPHLTRMFERRIPNRELRSRDEVTHHHIKTKTKFAERDFVHRAKEYWKHLPSVVQNKPSVNTFRSALKQGMMFEHFG